jgi:LPS export ABC transporter protein LptC
VSVLQTEQILLFPLLVAALGISSCGGASPKTDGGAAEGRVFREWMEMTGVRLRQYDETGPVWTLVAKGVDYERNTGEAVLRDAELRQAWTRPDGRRVDIVLLAPAGRARMNEGSVQMSGGVRCLDADGNSVETAAVDYDKGKRAMTAPGHVRFEGKGVVLESASFSADLEAGVYDFLGGVTGRFDPALIRRAKPFVPGER